MQVSRIFFIKLRSYTDIWKQLLIANDTNRVRGAVLGLSQDGACTDSFENFRENSLNGDLSNDITLNPPLFSLVNTFKDIKSKKVGSFYCKLFQMERCTMYGGWSRKMKRSTFFIRIVIYKMLVKMRPEGIRLPGIWPTEEKVANQEY
jgi:hypothetical protein